MRILDARGHPLEEVTVRLSSEEVTDLLVAASQIEDGSIDHALLRDPAGGMVGIYLETGEASPLERHWDWWVGPLLLLLAILLVTGAFSLGKGLLSLLF